MFRQGLMLRPMVVTNSTSEASTSRPSRNVLVSLSVVLRSLFADALMTNTFILTKSFNCLAASLFVFVCEFRMHCCAAALDGAHDFKTCIAGDFTHGADGAARLLEQDVPRPRRGAGADEDTLLAFHQRLWKAWGVTHHSIDLTVEHQLHLSWDVAPVAGRTHDDGIGLLHHLQYPLRIVLSECAFLFRAAGHTADTGLHGACPLRLRHQL